MSPNLETIVVKQLRLLTPGETASTLGIKPKTLEAWRAAGEGPPFVRVGRKIIRYPPDELILWVRAHRKSDSPSSTKSAA